MCTTGHWPHPCHSRRQQSHVKASHPPIPGHVRLGPGPKSQWTEPLLRMHGGQLHGNEGSGGQPSCRAAAVRQRQLAGVLLVAARLGAAGAFAGQGYCLAQPALHHPLDQQSLCDQVSIAVLVRHAVASSWECACFMLAVTGWGHVAHHEQLFCGLYYMYSTVS